MSGLNNESDSLVYIKRRHGIILLHEGHQYHTKRKHNSGLCIWQCTKRDTCKGILRIKADHIIDKKLHSCTPDFTKNVIDEALHKCKKEVIKLDFPNVPSTYNSTVASLQDSGVSLVCKIPNFINVKSTLYRHRNTAANLSKLQFRNVEEVEVPPKFEKFLIADYSCNNNRILLFASELAKRTISEYGDFYGDGTFKSCPKPFTELYTIHGDIGSTANHTNIVPLVYALMTTRDTQSYVILFSLIKSVLSGWNPRKFKVDYEQAVIKAVTKIFPNIEVKGCYYHYNRAIWAKGRDLGITRSQDKRKVRMVELSAVLPLLPQNKIMNGWQYIIRNAGADPEIKKFIDYMQKQWLREDFVNIWCAYGEQHRTTNSLEAWHFKLNRAVKQKSPNLMHFLNVLNEDSAYNNHRIRDIAMSFNSPLIKKRLKKSMMTDEFIKETQVQLVMGDISVGHCLEILRH